MQETCCDHRPACANRVAVRNGAAFNVHNVFAEAKLLQYRECDCRERLIDLNTLNVRYLPSCSPQGLADGRYRSQAEHARFNRTHAVGDKAPKRLETVLLGPVALGNDHRSSTSVEARCITSRDGAILAESRPELAEACDRGIRSVVLVLLE